MRRLKVGDKAPNFSRRAHDGREVSLKDYSGKADLILYFYPKDETKGCIIEACSFRDAYKQIKDLGGEVVGVSPDDDASHAKFAEKYKLPFPLLSDGDGSLRRLYGIKERLGLLPSRVTFIIDREGVIRHIFSSQLRPRRHVQEALEVLKKLRERPALAHFNSSTNPS